MRADRQALALMRQLEEHGVDVVAAMEQFVGEVEAIGVRIPEMDARLAAVRALIPQIAKPFPVCAHMIWTELAEMAIANGIILGKRIREGRS